MQVQSSKIIILCPECRKEDIIPIGEVKVHESCKVKGMSEVKCDECCGEDPYCISPTACQPKSKAMICREHNNELLFYCEKCDHLVCMYCTVKDHNGHNHDTVKKIVGKHR